MKISVIGLPRNLDECRRKFGADHHYSLIQDSTSHASSDVIFDFNKDGQRRLNVYDPSIPVFINIVMDSLLEMMHRENIGVNRNVFGFNGLPGFILHPVLEVSMLKGEQRTTLSELMLALRTEYEIVDDRVGMVTPRVIAMIINEAYYTVQERTAEKSDIDVAMKLGTNYPYGPFEWCDRIGLENVYGLLDALYMDTRDERYRVAPLLKQEYLRARISQY